MATQESPQELHGVAVEAEKYLEQLATGLAHAGASTETTKAVTQMAEVTRQIVAALGKGSEASPDEENPQEEAAPSEEADQPASMDQAAAETHQAMQSAAAKRKQ